MKTVLFMFVALWAAPAWAAVEVVSISPVAKPVVKAASRTYPIRNSFWSGCDGWRHLTVGPHKGKFDEVWLQSLSNKELQSLHSDDHEGRVKWDYAVRGPGTVAAAGDGCPDGNCPTAGRVPRGGRLRAALGR